MADLPVAERERAAAADPLAAAAQAAFASDKSPRVRRALASRPDLAPDAAQILSQDHDRQVREELATNPACPTDVLLVLLDDPQFHVRWGAAQNPAATREVHLAGLARGDQDVASAIGQLGDALHSDVIEALFAHAASAARERLTEATTDASLIERLANDEVPAVRAAASLSDVAPVDLLRRLATDPIAKVRATVAAGSRTPEDVLAQLATDKSANVRWWAELTLDGLQRQNDSPPIRP